MEPSSSSSLLPSSALVRGVVLYLPAQPHKWLVDVTQGRLQPPLALAGRHDVLKLLAPSFSHSYVLLWFNASSVKDGEKQRYSDDSVADG